MASTIVSLDTRRITDWESFHSVFAEVMGFPNFYGRNMNAWNDCMTYLDDPGAGMSAVHAPEGGVVVLQLEHVGNLRERCSELYDAIIEGCAFVNYRRMKVGEEPVLALSYWKQAG